MLRDELTKMKTESPERLTAKTGGCKFCGQFTQLEVPKNWNQEKINEAATQLCNCTEAEIYTRDEEQKERAKKAIKEQFGQQAGGGM